MVHHGSWFVMAQHGSSWNYPDFSLWFMMVPYGSPSFIMVHDGLVSWFIMVHVMIDHVSSWFSSIQALHTFIMIICLLSANNPPHMYQRYSSFSSLSHKSPHMYHRYSLVVYILSIFLSLELDGPTFPVARPEKLLVPHVLCLTAFMLSFGC